MVGDLLNKRLIFVTGKGGVGKTSLAAAIGSAIAGRGRRTVVVEVDNHTPSLPPILGVQASYEPVFASPELAVCNLTWQAALADWLHLNVPMERVARLVLNNRIVQTFLVATPGAHETVVLSKIASLLDEWDTVVVDLPASGHAISVLRVPQVTLRMVKSGPIRKRALDIISLLGDPMTACALVALPEEMVVNETIETYGRLRTDVPQLEIGLVAVNRAAVPSLTPDEEDLLSALSNTPDLTSEQAELLLAGRMEAHLEGSTRTALERLATETGASLMQFPRLGVLGGFAGGPERVIQQMSSALAREVVKEGTDGAI